MGVFLKFIIIIIKLRLLAHRRRFLANQKARNAIVGAENLLSSDICPWTLSVPRSSQFSVRFSEQIMSADKYPSIFSRQMAAIFYVYIRRFLWKLQAAKLFIISVDLQKPPKRRKGIFKVQNPIIVAAIFFCQFILQLRVYITLTLVCRIPSGPGCSKPRLN